MAQNAIVDWAPSGLRWKIERQFVLASINVLLGLKMQQSKTGTSAATYKLIELYFEHRLKFNKFDFVFGRLWCLLVEKNKLKLIKMSISRCLCNLILLKLFQSSLMGLAAYLKNNENI